MPNRLEVLSALSPTSSIFLAADLVPSPVLSRASSSRMNWRLSSAISTSQIPNVLVMIHYLKHREVAQSVRADARVHSQEGGCDLQKRPYADSGKLCKET